MRIASLATAGWGFRMALRHPNAVRLRTHLTLEERHVLYRLARERGGQTVMEIGTYLGASACAMAAGLRDSGRAGRIICVDTWMNYGMSEGVRDTWEEFVANTRPYRDLIHAVRGWSHELGAEVGRAAAGQLALVFFDGDHSELGLSRDWSVYRPMLGPGAVVAFHDIGWAEGVQKVVANAIEPELAWTRRLPNLLWGAIRT